MASERQGILEAQSNDTLSVIMGAVKGLTESVIAQTKSNRIVLQCMQEA